MIAAALAPAVVLADIDPPTVRILSLDGTALTVEVTKAGLIGERTVDLDLEDGRLYFPRHLHAADDEVADALDTAEVQAAIDLLDRENARAETYARCA